MKKIFFFFLISSAILSQQNLKEDLLLLKYNFSKNFYYQNEKLEKIYDEVSKEKKNTALAILYSMLIPGMGELYANNYESGKYFTIADGVLWGVFAGFNIYGKWKENNYKAFAQTKGGVNLQGKDEDYFTTIGIYISIDEYNRIRELNRDFSNVYDPQAYYWKWEDENQRKEYRQMWLSSEQAYNNVRFAVGALILNRIISAINAVRLVNAYNRNISYESAWGVNFSLLNNCYFKPVVSLNFFKRF